MAAPTSPACGCVAGSVAEHMLRRPKTMPSHASVAEVRAWFVDDHVHLALLVRGARLVGCVVRDDLIGVDANVPALDVSRITGRVIGPNATLSEAADLLAGAGVRRLAVVTTDLCLLGLLALKRSSTGFCTDEGVRARAASRAVGRAG